jgi:predicted nucleotidyltransferase
LEERASEAKVNTTNHQQEYHQQQVRLLDEVITRLRLDEQVLGLALAGSWAHGHPDAFSDIDLLCFLCDEERSGRPRLYEQIKAVAPAFLVDNSIDGM